MVKAQFIDTGQLSDERALVSADELKPFEKDAASKYVYDLLGTDYLN